MSANGPNHEAFQLKATEVEGAVPRDWREVLTAMANAVAGGDLSRLSLDARVATASHELEEHIRESIESYGATLTELPEETWHTSVCSWQGGHWSVLVDLWTIEEGCSDLVMQVRVTENEDRFLFALCLVYVP
ncbi:MAG: hypothetical protein ACK57J_19380 [Rubrivivax sp.]